MEAKTKRNLVIWGVLLLIILNVSSLGTIWYHRYQFNNDRVATRNNEEKIRARKDKSMRQRPRGGQAIGRGLELSSEQQIQFDSIWQLYNDRRDSIETLLVINRNEMGSIMSSSALDTITYYTLSNRQLLLISSLDRTMIDMNMALRGTLSLDQTKLFLEKIETLNKRRMHSRQGEKKRNKRTK